MKMTPVLWRCADDGSKQFAASLETESVERQALKMITCRQRLALSNLRPLPQQVVIHRGELDHRRMFRMVTRKLDDGGVEVEQEAALRVAAHHALDPEE